MITPHAVVDLPEDMADEVQFEIDGVTYDSVVHFLRRSIINFCESSHYWLEECEPITIVDGTKTYDLELDAATKSIVSVMQVFDADEVKLDACQDQSIARGYWQSTPTTIDIYPDDSLAGEVITVIAAIKPVLSGGLFKISAPLISEYRDAIIAGAKAMLYVMPNKSWSNLQLAQINKSTFDAIALDALRVQTNAYSRLNKKAPKKVREFY